MVKGLSWIKDSNSEKNEALSRGDRYIASGSADDMTIKAIGKYYGYNKPKVRTHLITDTRS